MSSTLDELALSTALVLGRPGAGKLQAVEAISVAGGSVVEPRFVTTYVAPSEVYIYTVSGGFVHDLVEVTVSQSPEFAEVLWVSA